jgi:hypothetical protein
MHCPQCALSYTDQRGYLLRELYEYRHVVPYVVVLLVPVSVPVSGVVWISCKMLLHFLFGPDTPAYT